MSAISGRKREQGELRRDARNTSTDFEGGPGAGNSVFCWNWSISYDAEFETPPVCSSVMPHNGKLYIETASAAR